MSASEIVNKVWSYTQVLCSPQNTFGFHHVFLELDSGCDVAGQPLKVSVELNSAMVGV